MKKDDSVKNNLVIIRKISRFIRGLTAGNTNSQKSQNRACLCTFKVALNPSESLPDFRIMHKTLISSSTILWSYKQKTAKFSLKPNKFSNNPQTLWRLSSKELCALSLVYNSTTLLLAVFVWGFQFTNRQLDRKTLEVDKWVSLESQTRQQLKLRQSRYR